MRPAERCSSSDVLAGLARVKNALTLQVRRNILGNERIYGWYNRQNTRPQLKSDIHHIFLDSDLTRLLANRPVLRLRNGMPQTQFKTFRTPGSFLGRLKCPQQILLQCQ
jgi:hypothetical protein